MKLEFGGIVPFMRVLKRGHPTIEVDVDDGKVECKKSASAWKSGKILSPLTVRGPVLSYEFALKATNPCSFAASITRADIDVLGMVEVDLSQRTLTFVGKVDQMPAYEMYARVDSGSVVTVFKERPTEEFWNFGLFSVKKGFEGLMGPPDRNISTRVSLPIHAGGWSDLVERCFPAGPVQLVQPLPM